jgi:hypothetical protein
MTMNLGGLGGLKGLGRALSNGVSFDLTEFMASQVDGLWFDLSETDRFFQGNAADVLADSVGEAIGVAMSQRAWNGDTLAEVLAAATELVSNGDFASLTTWEAKVGTLTLASGKARLAHSGSGRATKTSVAGVAVTLGHFYQIQGDLSGITATGAFLRLTTNADAFTDPLVATAASAADRKDTGFFVSTAATVWPALILSAVGQADFDNISIKRIPGKPGIQTNTSFKPLRQAAGAKFDGLDDNWLTNYVAAAAENFLGCRTTVPASLSAAQVILGASGAGANRCFLGIDTSGRACAGVGSDSTTTIVGTSDLRGTEAEVFLTFDGSTVRLIVNGAVEYQAAQNSTPTTTVPLRIGANNSNGTAASFYAGTVEEIWVGQEFISASRANQIANA